MTDFPDRLDEAIKESGRGSVRAFQQEMEARLRNSGVKGYSYPSILAYLNGEVSPRLEFISVAADALGVREAWLATGSGPRTLEEQRVAEAADGLDSRVRRAVKELPLAKGLEFMKSPGATGLFIEVVQRILLACPDVSDPTEEQIREVGKVVTQTVSIPATHFGEKRRPISGAAVARRYIAMLAALASTIPSRGEGPTYGEVTQRGPWERDTVGNVRPDEEGS